MNFYYNKRATISSRNPGESIVNFLTSRKIFPSYRKQHVSRLLSSRLAAANTLYQKDLVGHFGCVNALEFSKGGQYLLSGGDDRRVLLWDVNDILSNNNVKSPKVMDCVHRSNIFSLSFSINNDRVYSAGNDEKIIIHDLRTGSTLDVFTQLSAVYCVAVSPAVDNFFATASEDGKLQLYDTRADIWDNRDLVVSNSYYAYHSVQFHPRQAEYILSANYKEGVSLWDIRNRKRCVLTYGGRQSKVSSMSATFNSSGTQILSLRRKKCPVLYDSSNPLPVCQFDAPHYYNSCTMKSCTFAGSVDQFVLSGSDDFSLYMWKVPDCAYEEPSSHPPVQMHSMMLKGHRSIVNQVRYNDNLGIIASSGVGKTVKIWSSIELPGSCGTGLNNINRHIYSHNDYINLIMREGRDEPADYADGNTEEDTRMMAFFDSLVQREIDSFSSFSSDSYNLRGSSTEESNSSDSDDGGRTGGASGTAASNENAPTIISKANAIPHSSRTRSPGQLRPNLLRNSRENGNLPESTYDGFRNNTRDTQVQERLMSYNEIRNLMRTGEFDTDRMSMLLQALRDALRRDLRNTYSNELASSSTHGDNSTRNVTRPQTGGLSSQPQTGGLSSQPQTGLSSQPQTGGLSSQPQTGGLSSQPQTGGLSSLPQTGGFGSQPQTGGFGSHPQAGGLCSYPETGGLGSQSQTEGVSSQTENNNNSLSLSVSTGETAVYNSEFHSTSTNNVILRDIQQCPGPSGTSNVTKRFKTLFNSSSGESNSDGCDERENTFSRCIPNKSLWKRKRRSDSESSDDDLDCNQKISTSENQIKSSVKSVKNEILANNEAVNDSLDMNLSAGSSNGAPCQTNNNSLESINLSILSGSTRQRIDVNGTVSEVFYDNLGTNNNSSYELSVSRDATSSGLERVIEEALMQRNQDEDGAISLSEDYPQIRDRRNLQSRPDDLLLVDEEGVETVDSFFQRLNDEANSQSEAPSSLNAIFDLIKSKKRSQEKKRLEKARVRKIMRNTRKIALKTQERYRIRQSKKDSLFRRKNRGLSLSTLSSETPSTSGTSSTGQSQDHRFTSSSRPTLAPYTLVNMRDISSSEDSDHADVVYDEARVRNCIRKAMKIVQGEEVEAVLNTALFNKRKNENLDTSSEEENTSVLQRSKQMRRGRLVDDSSGSDTPNEGPMPFGEARLDNGGQATRGLSYYVPMDIGDSTSSNTPESGNVNATKRTYNILSKRVRNCDLANGVETSEEVSVPMGSRVAISSISTEEDGSVSYEVNNEPMNSSSQASVALLSSSSNDIELNSSSTRHEPQIENRRNNNKSENINSSRNDLIGREKKDINNIPIKLHIDSINDCNGSINAQNISDKEPILAGSSANGSSNGLPELQDGSFSEDATNQICPENTNESSNASFNFFKRSTKSKHLRGRSDLE